MNYDNFLETTRDVTKFKIEDVPGDNKCFYRAVINCLLFNSDLSTIESPIKFIRKKVFRAVNDPENFATNLSEMEEFLELSQSLLEMRVLKWIDRNRNMRYGDLGMTIKDLVEMTHEIPLDQYLYRDIDTYPIWGGFPEQIAIAKLYNIPIHVYRAVRFNKIKGKMDEGIIKTKIANKDVRFKLFQTIGDVNSKSPGINLLWKRYCTGEDHYMSLLPSSLDEH